MISISTKAIALDSYCSKLNIKPSFIKLDCEGVEYEIISGSRNILKHKPILAVELLRYSEKSGVRSQIVELLKEYSYKAYYIRDDFHLTPLNQKADIDIINAIFLPDSVELKEISPSVFSIK